MRRQSAILRNSSCEKGQHVGIGPTCSRCGVPACSSLEPETVRVVPTAGGPLTVGMLCSEPAGHAGPHRNWTDAKNRRW